MGLGIDFLGFRYDKADGSFLRVGPGWLWHRPSNKFYDASGINAAMAAAKYTPDADEIKRNDKLVATEMIGFDVGAAMGGGTPPVGVPITATVAGTGSDTVTITIAGGPIGSPAKLTIAGISVDGTAIDDPAEVNISANADAASVATKVARAIDGQQDAGTTITVSATANGAVVTLTQAGSTGAGNFDAGITATVA